MNCCLGQLCHFLNIYFFFTTESLLPLRKVSLTLRALVYNLIKTCFVGKYFMGIQSLILYLLRESIENCSLVLEISYYYSQTRNLVSILLLANCFCWYIIFLF